MTKESGTLWYYRQIILSRFREGHSGVATHVARRNQPEIAVRLLLLAAIIEWPCL